MDFSLWNAIIFIKGISLRITICSGVISTCVLVWFIRRGLDSCTFFIDHWKYTLPLSHVVNWTIRVQQWSRYVFTQPRVTRGVQVKQDKSLKPTNQQPSYRTKVCSLHTSQSFNRVTLFVDSLWYMKLYIALYSASCNTKKTGNGEQTCYFLIRVKCFYWEMTISSPMASINDIFHKYFLLKLCRIHRPPSLDRIDEY